MRRSLLVICSVLLILVIAAPAGARSAGPVSVSWSIEARLKYLGTGGVAVSGSTAVITGAATYVFVRSDAGEWSQQAELTDPSGASIGGPLAISGDTVLVGAPGKAPHGAVYVFDRSGTTWSEEAELTAAHGKVGDGFGASVAISGDTAVVGAPDRNSTFGAAFAFARSGTNWSQVAELTASGSHRHDSFGASVAISGDTALVGAPFKGNVRGRAEGAAYVFHRSKGHWLRPVMLTDSPGHFFGSSVSVDGSVAVVGSPGSAGYTGAAFEFVQTDGTWSMQGSQYGEHKENRFGASVAVSGMIAAVSAPDRNRYGNGFVGCYLFALA